MIFLFTFYLLDLLFDYFHYCISENRFYFHVFVSCGAATKMRSEARICDFGHLRRAFVKVLDSNIHY